MKIPIMRPHFPIFFISIRYVIKRTASANSHADTSPQNIPSYPISLVSTVAHSSRIASCAKLDIIGTTVLLMPCSTALRMYRIYKNGKKTASIFRNSNPYPSTASIISEVSINSCKILLPPIAIIPEHTRETATPMATLAWTPCLIRSVLSAP